MGEDFSHLGEVLFEIITLGQTARVTAVQAATGREATIVCPSRLTRFSMELAALRKLNLQVKPPPSISYR